SVTTTHASHTRINRASTALPSLHHEHLKITFTCGLQCLLRILPCRSFVGLAGDHAGGGFVRAQAAQGDGVGERTVLSRPRTPRTATGLMTDCGKSRPPSKMRPVDDILYFGYVSDRYAGPVSHSRPDSGRKACLLDRAETGCSHGL